jgi:hypothetical protein
MTSVLIKEGSGDVFGPLLLLLQLFMFQHTILKARLNGQKVGQRKGEASLIEM